MLNIAKLKIRFSKNKINIVKISSGTIVGQIISIITLPIIARIYGAEIIGMWTILHSFALIITSFSDFGLINSIIVEAEEDLETNYKVISTLSTVTSILGSLVFTIFIIIFYSDVVKIDYFLFFALLTIMSFTLQQAQICYSWLNREKNYDVLMKNPIINYGLYGFLSICLGFFGANSLLFFASHIIGQVAALLNMKRYLPRKMFSFSIQDFIYILKRHRKYIVIQTPTNILNNFKAQVPIFLITNFWGTEMLGYYSITIRVLQAPSAFLAKAIGQVFFQITSEMKREQKEIGDYVFKNLKMGMKLSIVPITLLMAFGDVITVIFLGEDWRIAGEFVRILGLQYFFMFLMNSVQGLSITLDKQDYAMVSNILQILGYTLGAIVGIYFFQDIYIMLVSMSFFFIIIQIWYFCALFRIMNMSRKKYVINVLGCLLLMLVLSYTIRIIFEFMGVINFIYGVFGRT
jgi:O-antigen/teichoic acid export membrane protein